MLKTWVDVRSGLAIGVLAALAIGCSTTPREDESEPVPTGNSESATSGSTGTPGTTGAGATDTATSTSSPTGATTEQDSSSTTNPFILDVGFDTESESASATKGDMGCRKVDFLFIIDNSGSMSEEQDSLIASFPGFIDTIQTTIADAQDYHVMVLDTDAWVFSGCAGLACPAPPASCFAGNICLPFGEECFGCTFYALCDGIDCANPGGAECEDVLGAGVTHPRGSQSSNQDCNFASGTRFMDSSEPDLGAAFQCAARVGTGSTDGTERPMEAMVASVSPQTEAFACNDEFIRDDAILVVTFVTDEDDNGDSQGSVDGWRQALIAAKGGDESAVVVLGLFGDNDQPGAICGAFDPEGGNGAEPSANLRSFVESWGARGFSGSVCADDYSPFFEEAVGIIDTTCEEFEPPEG